MLSTCFPHEELRPPIQRQKYDVISYCYESYNGDLYNNLQQKLEPKLTSIPRKALQTVRRESSAQCKACLVYYEDSDMAKEKYAKVRIWHNNWLFLKIQRQTVKDLGYYATSAFYSLSNECPWGILSRMWKADLHSWKSPHRKMKDLKKWAEEERPVRSLRQALRWDTVLVSIPKHAGTLISAERSEALAIWEAVSDMERS